MKLIKNVLNKVNSCATTEDYLELIENWIEWYEGETDFHDYTITNLQNNTVKKQRLSLKMAKKVAEDWTDLVYAEGIDIEISNKQTHEIIKAILNENKFTYQFGNVLEKMFAIGTIAMIEFINDQNKVVIDFVEADLIIPVSYDSGEITSFIAISQAKEDDIYINTVVTHSYDKGVYSVKYKRYESEEDDELGDFKELLSESNIETDVPMFQFLKPNIANNFEMRNPLGVSVYGNSIDTLKAIDTKYDSFHNEFVTGKNRIIVSSDLVKTNVSQVDTVVNRIQYFDSDETVFQKMPFDSETSDPVRQINMNLRTQEHIDAINCELNLLSQKIGLGAGYYEFTTNGLKTATEVISENSDTYRTIKKHQMIIGSCVKGMVLAICKLLNISNDFELKINFDDSIINDQNTKIDNGIKEVSAGLMSKKTYMIDVKGYTEQRADEEITRINAESGIQSLDMIMSN